jgi:hypothetical protein
MMAKTSIYVWHDAMGSILAVGHPSTDSDRRIVPLTEEHQLVLQTEFEETHINKLPETHVVDVHKKTLVKVGCRRE